MSFVQNGEEILTSNQTNYQESIQTAAVLLTVEGVPSHTKPLALV